MSRAFPFVGGARPPLFAVDFAVVWSLGLLIRSSLFFVLTGTPFPDSPLTGFEEMGLVALRLISSIPGTLVFACAFTALRATSRLEPRMARIARGLCWAVPLTLALVSFSSWAAFYATGQFAGTDAWTLMISNPVLLLDHVVEIAPIAIVAVPAIAIAVVVANARLCTAATGWPTSRVRALVGGVAFVHIACVPLAFAADVATERDTRPVRVGAAGEVESAHEIFVTIGAEKNGPIARLLVDGFHAVTTTTLRAARWADFGARGAAVITADDYAKEVATAKRPHKNVIVVLVESLRRDELAFEGGTRVVMPAVEALAREGTVYTHVVAPAAQSDYATTSILSSQYPLRGVAYHPFAHQPAYPRVLPYDILHRLGYRTAVFSSQNEYWGGMYYFLQTGTIDHFLHAETFAGATYSANADRGLHEWIEKTGHAGKIDDSNTIDEAIAWTDSIAPNAPFFAYVNLQSSHNPYLLEHHVPPQFGSGHVSFPILFDVYPADSAGAVRDLYDNCLAYADAQLARLFDSLKQSGRWDSTIVVVVGDHGEAFYEHGFGAHGGELYGEVTRVPLVIRVPRTVAARDTLPASSIDIMPTLLGLLSLPPHPAYQGIDLARISERSNRPLFSLTQTAMANEVSVEQNQWALQFDARHSVSRLFDLRNDPGETRDVADEFPSQRDAMMETVATWWAKQVGYYDKATASAAYYAPALAITVPLTPPARKK